MSSSAAYPHSLFSGRMTYISDVLDPATRTMRIRVTVPNPGSCVEAGNVRHGSRRCLAATRCALTVPLSAIQQEGAGKLLFVRQSGESIRAAPRSVER